MKNLLLALLTSVVLLSGSAGQASAAAQTSVGTAVSAIQHQSDASVETKIDPKTYVVYITRTGKKYHLENCRYLSKSKIKTTLEKARKSYEPCKVCKPPS